MNLTELRGNWEQMMAVTAKVTHSDGGYKTVLVVLKKGAEYFVHRYFTIGADWQISVDYTGDSLDEALKVVTEYFDDIYPTE